MSRLDGIPVLDNLSVLRVLCTWIHFYEFYCRKSGRAAERVVSLFRYFVILRWFFVGFSNIETNDVKSLDFIVNSKWCSDVNYEQTLIKE